MGHSARIPEIYVYIHVVYQQHERIYGPKAMNSCFLSARESRLIRYFDVFLPISNLSSLVLNDTEHALKLKHKSKLL